MRNLKRALSLTLASVMLLGMMVVGAGAAGYPDVDEEDNVEAIEVLKAVKVMVGDDNGNFDPDRNVSRSEMAVVMALLLDLDYQYYEASCPFWDVPTWAKGYVGACYANGITSGYNATTYGAADTITPVQAASMMMRALGYFKYSSDYKDGFELATVRQGSKIGIFDGVGSSATAPMTRNEVAKMALNALQTPIVEAEDNTININSTTGDAQITVTGGQVNYVVTASNKDFAKAIDDAEAQGTGLNKVNGYIIELGEKLYNGKLKLNNDIDAFGRPARKWEYDGKAVGTYAKEELKTKEYVGKVTGKTLYDLIGKATLDEYDTYCFIDGVYTSTDLAKTILDSTAKNTPWFDVDDLNRNNDAAIGGTGNGTLTQVYLDHEDDDVYVVVINTYLAIADKDYDEKKEEASIKAYSIDKKTGDEYVKVAKNGEEVEKITLAVEDFPSVKDIKKDDALLITVAEGEVQTLKPAEVMEGVTITSFKRDDNIVVSGETYKYATTAGYEDKSLKYYTGESSGVENLKDQTYNVYLDVYGNLIGLKEVEAKKNYVFITGIDLNSGNLANKTADASAIFLDGTMDSIKINMTKSEWQTSGRHGALGANGNDNAILNTWCTYTKSGDVYTVKEVRDTAAGAAHKPDSTHDLAQYNKTEAASNFPLDEKNYRLPGGPDSDFSTGKTYSSVYTDEDTVFITAKLGELVKAGGNYGIIKDVSSVSVGVSKASLEVWSTALAVTKAEDTKVSGTVAASRVANGAYYLYNDDGIIIAAVVVGEDGESAKDLVYVHTSGLEKETYNGSSSDTKAAGDGLWTWERYVVRNGEEVLLTEVGDSVSYLKDMDRYKWYQIRTNANGEVIDAEPAASALAGSVTSKYITNYADINSTVETNGVDTVLYLTNGGPGSDNTNGFNNTDELKIKGTNTLAVTNQQGSGFHFANDVNVVLQYWNKNTQKEEILTGNGKDDLEDMIEIVNDEAGTEAEGKRGDNSYYVSALIEKGFATTIVIYDSYNNYKRPGTVVQEPDGGTWTLTLTGDLTDAVVSNGTKTLEPSATRTTIDGTVVEYKITKNTEVFITDDDLASAAVTDAIFNGVAVKINKTSKVMALTMTNDATVTLPTAADKLYTVTFADGVTVDPTKFYGYISGTKTPITAAKVSGNVYYFKDSDNLQWMTVTTTNKDRAIALPDDGNTFALAKSGYDIAKGGEGVATEMQLSGVLSANMKVYEAVKITAGTGMKGTVAGLNFDVGDSGLKEVYVVYNKTVAVTKDASLSSQSAVIAGGGSTTYGDDVLTTGLKATTDVKLYPAVKLTLIDTTAKLYQTTTATGSYVEVGPGEYTIKSGNMVDVSAPYTFSSVAARDAATTGTAHTDAAVSTDTTYVGGVKVTIENSKANIEIKTKDTNGSEVTIAVGDGASAKSIFVKPGAELTVATTDGTALQFKTATITSAKAVNAASGVPTWIKAGGATSAAVTVGEDVTFTYGE